MKKFLLLLVCLITFSWLHAETVTFTCADNFGSATLSSISDWQLNDVLKFTFNKADGSTNPAYNKAGDARLYAKNTATLSAIAGYKIESVVFTLSTQGKAQYATITVDNGTIATQSKSDSSCNWSGDANSITFTVGATNTYGSSTSKTAGQLCFSSVTITYSKVGDATKVATPVFTPAGGKVEAGTKVTISCATEGATIEYVLNGGNDYIEYSGEEIVINEATTIEAYATKDGLEMSDIAEASYTIKKTAVADIAEFITLAESTPTDLISIENPVTAVYQNGINLFIKDNSGWLLVFGTVGQTYNNGDVIAAGIKGKSQNYNGTFELSSPDATTFAAGVAGAPVEPVAVTEISAADVNKYVVVENVTINGTTATTADGKEIALYNKFSINIPAGSNMTVKGFVNIFNNTTIQLWPIEITTAAGEEIVATPTFNPESGEVAKGTVVTISCATEGATIEYVLNGGSDYIVYNGEGIVINEATTIEAYATKDGFEMSDIAEAAYTIALEQVASPTFDPASGSVERGSEVTIACATEGATIYYQANNGELLEYTGEPIVINEATKIEAWAEKEGMKDSEIVSVSYTIVGEEPHAPEAMFDFTDPANFGISEPGSVLNHPFTVNGVTVEFTQSAGGNEPTFYATGGYHIRVYKNATIVVSAEEGKSIESITFTGATLYRIQHNGTAIAESGQTTVNWLSPSLNARAAAPNTVTFTIDSSGRADIKTMKVNDPVVTGVEDVVVDENAPVEYYNLQGVRVANPENGIFIRRQGNKATKVVVK